MALTEKLTDIADSIRSMTGKADSLSLTEMPDEILGIETGIAPSEKAWNSIPSAVKAYLDTVSYSSSDYTVSHIAEYAPSTAVEGNYFPVGISINTVGGTLERGGYRQPVSSGINTFYNDIPSAITPFSVSSANTVLQVGTLQPAGALRMIKCPGVYNMRDLGGWACDGGTVKYGKLFRGSQIFSDSSGARDVLLNQLGIRYELDLRAANEISNTLASYIGYSNVEGQFYYLTNNAAYKKMLCTVFDCVANNLPLYFHCQAGADRAGILSMLIEAILGVSQSDIDKDYELSSFYTGSANSSVRARSSADWQRIITAINEFSGASFRDKVINYVASLGFTANEINAFRVAMIDGSPQLVTPDISTFTVSNTLSHATSSNSSASATQYQAYEAEITPDSGYLISSVSVTMGGADITEQVWSGNESFLYFEVANTLSNCSTDNNKSSVIAGQSYGATLTANEGYSLDCATITITMGGIDVSSYYSNGKIAIPSVTGNIVITATAVSSAPSITNVLDSVGYTDGTRISTSSGDDRAEAGATATNKFSFSDYANTGDTIRFYNPSGFPSTSNTKSASACWTSSDVLISGYYLTASNVGATQCGLRYTNLSSDGKTLTATLVDSSYKVRFGFIGNGSDIIITVNQEIS